MRGPPARHEEPKEQLPAVEGIIMDAAELKAGDRVVYPNQGVCRITGVEVKEIAGQKLELVRMEREEDGAAVLVPKGKVPSIGLRKVASGDQIEGVFHYLAAQYDDPELDWKVRHRDNADRLIAGGVLGVAEVVKGLHALSRIRPLPAKEREQYDNARHLLVHEISVSLAVPMGLAEDFIDYALMPPVGVTFKLKPPPKPVELPSRPRRKVARTDDEDLGLDDLGLGELGELPEPGAEPPEGESAEAETAAPGIPSPEDIPLPDIDALPPLEGEEEPAPGPEAEGAEAEGAGEADGEAEADEDEEDEDDDAGAKRGRKAAPKKGAAAEKKPAAKKAAPAAKPRVAVEPKKKPAAKPAPVKKPAPPKGKKK
ncbi:MAG TPA: CarD family transcriptional regulator [Anaeromyxobacteraceae bacterium]|nr:CarD family transcriptional regulator [Anaeromyxobacteraceae bacterium]